MPYSDLLRDPRWQKKRLEIFERDEWTCRACFDPTKTLHAHHLAYQNGKLPWDYKNDTLLTLCEECHELASGKRPGISPGEMGLIKALRSAWVNTLGAQDIDGDSYDSYEVMVGQLRNSIWTDPAHTAPRLLRAIGSLVTLSLMERLISFAEEIGGEWWKEEMRRISVER